MRESLPSRDIAILFSSLDIAIDVSRLVDLGAAASLELVGLVDLVRTVVHRRLLRNGWVFLHLQD